MTAPQPAARPGRACPAFAFTSAQGQHVSSRELLGRKALAIVFVSAPLAPEMLERWEILARRYPNELTAQYELGRSYVLLLCEFSSGAWFPRARPRARPRRRELARPLVPVVDA